MHDLRSFYIDGQWVAASEDQPLEVVDPATEHPVATVSLGGQADVDRAVAAARRAFPSFARTSVERRLELLDRIVAAYRRRAGELARAVTAEMGAPATLAAEAQVPAGLVHFEQSRRTLEGYRFTEQASATSRVFREPIGVCAFITPWNWPLNQIAAKLGPALAVGCTVVHKPSEIAPISAHILAEILDEAGVPAGVYNLVDGDGPTVGAALAAHPGVDLVSFTGSTRAGIEVARSAAPTVKRVTQELGGKSANIILDDADLEQAVADGARACFGNSGQSCDAPTRMLVPQARMEDAMEIAAWVAAGLHVGDPTRPDTDLGPIAYDRQYAKVVDLIERGIKEGATLAVGGPELPQGIRHGYFVRPSVFGKVDNAMAIAREEIFGPVLAIIGYADEDDAVAIANDTPYGLSGYVSSGDLERARRVARRLRTGQIHINGADDDPAAPFGGYKLSGNGREFATWGFNDFTELKAVMGYEAA